MTATAMQLVADPATNEFEQTTKTLAELAQELKVVDEESYLAAAGHLTGIATLEKQIAEHHDPIIQSAHRTHKLACDAKNRLLAPLAEARAILNTSVKKYNTAQEAKREQERQLLQAEAKKREEDRMLAEAMAAEADGNVEVANQILSEPIAPPPVAVRPAVPTRKEAGISFREVVKFEVTLRDLIKHCAAHPEDENLLQANTVAVRARANSQRTACNVGGVKVWIEKEPVRGGR